MVSTGGAAYQVLRSEALGRSAHQPCWQPGDGPLPVLFVSHGAPPLLDDEVWMRELLDWSTGLPKPRAILVVSAHWESAPLMLSASAPGTPLVYDFSGFDPRFFSLRYVTPDASGLADLVSAVMPDVEPVHRHPSRGLDHGAWVPLLVMYPAGDVPVLQVSIPSHDPDRLLRLGERLRPLRERGVLVVASGFATHGLPFMTREMVSGLHVPGWSREFDAWAWEAVGRGDVDTLASFSSAPGMPYAHPSPEHFTPLFVALGAAAGGSAVSMVEGYKWGLSKRSVMFG